MKLLPMLLNPYVLKDNIYLHKETVCLQQHPHQHPLQ